MIKRVFLQAGLLSWELLCLALFVYGVGQRSGVHLVSIESLNWVDLQSANIHFGAFFAALLQSFLGITVFSLSLVGYGIAFWVLAGWKEIPTQNIGEVTVTAFAVGQSIVSFLTLMPLVFIQQFLWLYNFVIVGSGLIFLFISIVLNRHKILTWMVNLLSVFRISSNVFFVSLIVFGVTLLYSASRLSYDAATQYFAQAKMIALSNRLVMLSFKDAFAGSALYLTNLYAVVIQLFGDQAARMLSWVNGGAILASSIMIGEKIGLSRRAIGLFPAFALTSTAFVDLLGDGKIDLASTLNILVTVYWFLQSLQKKLKRPFLLTGFLSGFSIIVRPYNAILLSLFFFSIFLFHFFYLHKADRAVFFRSKIVDLLKLSLPGLFFWVASYLVVNALVLKNPFAPLSAFGLSTDDWPFYPSGFQASILILLYPFVITFSGFFDTLGFISPFFLAFVPLLFSKEIRSIRLFSKELFFVFFSSLIVLYLWVGLLRIHVFEVRYVFFLWLILFLPIVHVVDSAMQVDLFLRARTQIIFNVILVFMALRVFLISFATYSANSTNQTWTCHDLPMCTFFEPINRLANPGDRVLVLGGYRYYLRSDLFACSSTGNEYLALESAAANGSDAFWREVIRQGYRFIIYDSFYNSYLLRFRSLPDLHEHPAWLRITILHDETFKDYDLRDITESVYEIDANFSSETPLKTCVFDGENWKVQIKK